jgi:hypothetical protein
MPKFSGGCGMDNFEDGIRLFNEGKYMKAHEEWEALWILLPESPRKGFLQGLTMIAAALQKYEKKQYADMEKLTQSGIVFLRENSEGTFRIDFDDFLAQTEAFWSGYLSGSLKGKKADLPKIKQLTAVV